MTLAAQVTYVGHMTNVAAKGGVIPDFRLGDRMRLAREHAGLEQKEIAEEVGVARQSVSNYETSKTTPGSRWILRRWAEVTGVDYNWLAFGQAPGDQGGSADLSATISEDQSSDSPSDSETPAHGPSTGELVGMRKSLREALRARRGHEVAPTSDTTGQRHTRSGNGSGTSRAERSSQFVSVMRGR